MTPTEEQIKKFWEWCGFKKREYDTTGFIVHITDWKYPNGKYHDNLPDLDLNSLFKYPVPKLMKDGWACRVQSSPLRDNDTGKTIFEWSGYAEVFYIRYDKPLSFKTNHYAIDADPALALFWAIWEIKNLA